MNASTNLLLNSYQHVYTQSCLPKSVITTNIITTIIIISTTIINNNTFNNVAITISNMYAMPVCPLHSARNTVP